MKSQPPKFTPFSNLHLDEQMRLAWQIFKEAQYNIQKKISKNDPLYDDEVEKEADRLLENWMKRK